jgi:hypothetical protein
MARRWQCMGMVLWMFSLAGACGDDAGDDGAGMAAGMGGSAGGTSGTNDRETTCERTCSSMTALSCAGDDPSTCMSTCYMYWDMPTCTDEVRAVVTCSANSPASAWECDEDDEANLMAGHCETELATLTACVGG